jgi:hypothetical protein
VTDKDDAGTEYGCGDVSRLSLKAGCDSYDFGVDGGGGAERARGYCGSRWEPLKIGKISKIAMIFTVIARNSHGQFSKIGITTRWTPRTPKKITQKAPNRFPV